MRRAVGIPGPTGVGCGPHGDHRLPRRRGRDHLRRLADPRVGLVIPFGSRVATSRINFRLLAREAMSHGRRLDIVAPDASARALAASAGLPVFASVGEYEDALDTEDDEKDARRAASRAAAGLAGGAAAAGGTASASTPAEQRGAAAAASTGGT